MIALTPHALTSYWVRKETSTARLLAGRNEIGLVFLDVAECEMPSSWKTYQYATFRAGYERGLNELLQYLNGESVRPDRHIHEKTGIELIRIPAGPFLYGSSDADTVARDNEKPQRTVDLPEYWIGRYPVTNAQFAKFIQSTGHITKAEREGSGRVFTSRQWEIINGADWRHPTGPRSSSSGRENHPVVQISWDDAKAFCDWAGLVLPTKEQWEKGARGTHDRIWPWGNEEPTAEHCNFSGHIDATTPVGKYSPKGDSPFGCGDMAGNVWEWTESSWGDEARAPRVVRGGSWNLNQYVARAAYRFDLHLGGRDFRLGFRVVRRPPSQAL